MIPFLWGAHITNDISIELRISLDEAEKLKREYELATYFID